MQPKHKFFIDFGAFEENTYICIRTIDYTMLIGRENEVRILRDAVSQFRRK